MKRILKKIGKDLKMIAKHQIGTLFFQVGPLAFLKIFDKTLRNYLVRILQEYGANYCIKKVMEICDDYGYDKEKVLKDMKQRGLDRIHAKMSGDEDFDTYEDLRGWYDHMVESYGPGGAAA